MARLPVVSENVEVENEYLHNRPGQPPAAWFFAWDVLVLQGKHKLINRRKRRIIELTAPTQDELDAKFVEFFEQPNVKVLEGEQAI